MSNLAAIFGPGFDTNTVEPQGDFDVLPPGKYPVVIDKAEVKQTKKMDGHYLSLTMTVADGGYKGRKLWPKIQIQNPSQECVKIGLRTLSALGKATGVTYISDANQFLGKTCIAHVKVKDEQNEIRTYSAMEGPVATQPVAPAPTTQYAVPPQTPPYAQEQAPQCPAAAPQGAAVGPIGQPTTAGKAPWQR